jgi:hypothetical protein
MRSNVYICQLIFKAIECSQKNLFIDRPNFKLKKQVITLLENKQEDKIKYETFFRIMILYYWNRPVVKDIFSKVQIRILQHELIVGGDFLSQNEEILERVWD